VNGSEDPFRIDRFVEAQKSVYTQVISELSSGRKVGHWMWFIFPQLRGLGWSPTSVKFGISSEEEARGYLQHPVLGTRLKECTALVVGIEGRPIEAVFGPVDSMKFRSCMTLFARISPDDDIFLRALQKYFGGVPDQLTLDRL
jgi:uncharacterized protein (DUF1810 family)